MGVKQREWGIYIRPYYERNEGGKTVKVFHTLPNKNVYIGDRTPVEREVKYNCRGVVDSFSYYMPEFVERVDIRSFKYWCNYEERTINYGFPTFSPSANDEVKGDYGEDGLWSLYYRTTSYVYLMEKLQELQSEIGEDLSHVKVVELFDFDIERMILNWNGGDKGEIS